MFVLIPSLPQPLSQPESGVSDGLGQKMPYKWVRRDVCRDAYWSASGADATGNRALNVQPPRARLATDSRPPCVRAISRAMLRPNPAPEPFAPPSPR